MKRLNIIKRITPVLAASVAVSALYTGGVLANAEEHTVYIEDIFDTVEIGAGYYEEPVYVKTNLVAPDKFVAEPYSDGNNNTIDADRTLSRTELDLNTYSDGLNYDISVGVDEQLTLSPGYYYGNINIKNGVKDNGDPSAVLDGNNQYVDLPAGFYNTGRVGINSTAWVGLVSAINTNFGTNYTGDESFASIAEGITGEKFSYNSTGTAKYTQKSEGTNTRIGTSPTNTTVSGISLAGETIDLGVDETLVIPAGYYGDAITLQSGIKNNGVPSATLDGNSQSANLPAGYYDEGSISISSTWFGLVSAINNVFGTSFTGNESFNEITSGIAGDKFAHNATGTATYTFKNTGSNTRIGTSSTSTSISGVDLAGETIDLGVDETIVIPAGYYGEAITIQNGVLHNENVNTNVSANNNAANGSNEVTYGPGYYDSITVKDNTSKGTIKKTSLSGVTKQYNSLNNKWE